MIKNQLLESTTLSSVVIKGLQELKGQEIIRMNLKNTDGAVSDYFVICTGTSDKHVQSLAESVIKFTREQAAEKPFSSEGLQAGEWILLDYVNVVVHIFQRRSREFFRLEDLWGDAEFERIEDSV